MFSGALVKTDRRSANTVLQGLDKKNFGNKCTFKLSASVSDVETSLEYLFVHYGQERPVHPPITDASKSFINHLNNIIITNAI